MEDTSPTLDETLSCLLRLKARTGTPVAELTESDVISLYDSEMCQVARFQRNELIIKEGEESSFVAIILDGELEAQIYRDGACVDRHPCPAGHLLGEMSLFDETAESPQSHQYHLRTARVVCKSAQAILMIIMFDSMDAMRQNSELEPIRLKLLLMFARFKMHRMATDEVTGVPAMSPRAVSNSRRPTAREFPPIQVGNSDRNLVIEDSPKSSMTVTVLTGALDQSPLNDTNAPTDDIALPQFNRRRSSVHAFPDPTSPMHRSRSTGTLMRFDPPAPQDSSTEPSQPSTGDSTRVGSPVHSTANSPGPSSPQRGSGEHHLQVGDAGNGASMSRSSTPAPQKRNLSSTAPPSANSDFRQRQEEALFRYRLRGAAKIQADQALHAKQKQQAENHRDRQVTIILEGYQRVVREQQTRIDQMECDAGEQQATIDRLRSDLERVTGKWRDRRQQCTEYEFQISSMQQQMENLKKCLVSERSDREALLQIERESFERSIDSERQTISELQALVMARDERIHQLQVQLSQANQRCAENFNMAQAECVLLVSLHFFLSFVVCL